MKAIITQGPPGSGKTTWAENTFKFRRDFCTELARCPKRCHRAHG